MSLVSIIIPTWNNPQYLIPCIQSILLYTMPDDLFHIYIVNNGVKESLPAFDSPYVTVLQQDRNLGWEGGLKAGLAASKEPYVLLLNDDTFVPSHQRLWLSKMLNHFAYSDCAAVGPTSNCVMGKQNVNYHVYPDILHAKFLVNFCCLVRRADLEAAGGVDDTLPGGDDLDQSIRLRKLGKYLLIDRDIFIYHHGFKTGERVAGSPAVAGGWNSVQKIEKTNWAIMKKHGLRDFLDLWSDQPSPNTGVSQDWGDPEGEIVKRFTVGEKIAELGCGDKKIFPKSIGIDLVPKGQEIPGLKRGRLSMADISSDIEYELPIKDYDTLIAQHVLEHTISPVETVQAWRKSLKHGGRVIIAVPDDTIRRTIPMDWTHRHAWTPQSLKAFMEALGWKTVDMLDCKNNVSFVGVFEANGL